MLGFCPLAARPLAAAIEPAVMGLLGDTGAFVLTGQDVRLAFDRKLAADAGAFVLSGQDIDIILSLSPVALSRVFLTGTTATRIFGVKMIQNFTMTAGDTKTLVVSVTDAEGSAVNITGATIRWVCKRSLGKAASISKTTVLGISLTDAVNGQFTVTLNPSDTDDLAGIFQHEVELTASDGTISTILSGTMKVNKALIEAT